MDIILFATSDGETGATLSAELEGMGYQADWTLDGFALCEAAAKLQPVAVILDRNLEVFSGLDSASRLRADPDIPPHLPLILLSDDDLDSHLLEKAGISAVIGKTHSFHELQELLSRLLHP